MLNLFIFLYLCGFKISVEHKKKFYNVGPMLIQQRLLNTNILSVGEAPFLSRKFDFYDDFWT